MNEMTITSAQYKNGIGNSPIGIIATIDNVEMSVPLDPANRHYAAIKAKHDDADDSFTIQDAD